MPEELKDSPSVFGPLSDQEEARYKNNIEKYGYRSWYEFANAEWETKWDTFDTVIMDMKRGKRLMFETAWAPFGNKVFLKMSEMFPDLKFTLRYWEGGMQFKGKRVAKGGIILTDESSEYYGRRGG
jgi:hypothetical protein